MKIHTKGLKKKLQDFSDDEHDKKGRLMGRPGNLVFDNLLGGLVLSVVARDGHDVGTG